MMTAKELAKFAALAGEPAMKLRDNYLEVMPGPLIGFVVDDSSPRGRAFLELYTSEDERRAWRAGRPAGVPPVMTFFVRAAQAYHIVNGISRLLEASPWFTAEELADESKLILGLVYQGGIDVLQLMPPPAEGGAG